MLLGGWVVCRLAGCIERLLCVDEWMDAWIDDWVDGELMEVWMCGVELRRNEGQLKDRCSIKAELVED